MYKHYSKQFMQALIHNTILFILHSH